MVFALIGNQNCGKTTLFNQLTGSNQHVGNFPGVTVEKKEGIIKKAKKATVVDLPGIYSLSPYTSEEIVTRDFLLKDRPDGIINIIDATNIERNLYLTLQLIELNMPMVVALNMMDEIDASGGSIDIGRLENGLGVKVVPICASKNEGVTELIDKIMEVAQNKISPKRQDFCKGYIHRAIHSVAHLIEDHAQMHKIPSRYAATKLIEGDKPTLDQLELNQNELETLDHIINEMETALDTDREAAMADMRYTYIENLTRAAVTKPTQTKEQQRSVKIDRILTHKIFALPIFICIMAVVFFLTFGVFGKVLSDWTSLLIDNITAFTDNALTQYGLNPILHSLIIDGIFNGVGSVMSFLPTIVVLFFFLSLLEDSGYMARVAFVMDKLLRKIGLSGKSFVPMIIGFGCSVPAIMATRTLSSERDRKMTIMLIPFMSCSAKLPIYALFTAAFFEKYQVLVMIFLYLLGMVVSVLCALLLKSTIFKGDSIPFIMELPAYRMPSAKSLVIHMWEKAKSFVKKAFTIILAATIIIWILQSFDLKFNIVENSADSMLALLGGLIAPIFIPLGFGNWQAATALITGLSAKETVVSTLSILTGPDMPLSSIFPTHIAALSFLVFTLLYMPCVAAFATTRKELGKTSLAIGAMAFQTCVAWLVSFIIFSFGTLFI